MNHLITIGIHHLGMTVSRANGSMRAVDVLVAVNQVARAIDVHQTQEGLEAGVAEISTVVDAVGWGVGDQDVQKPTTSQPIPPQRRDHP